MAEAIKTVADETKNRLTAGPVPAGVRRSVNASFVEPKRKATP